jgi:hypothetical protein
MKARCLRLHGEHQARAHRLALKEHRAGATDAVLAADMRAQHIRERVARLGVDDALAAVDA